MTVSLLESFLLFVYRRVSSIYVLLFGRPSAQRMNNAIMQLTFKARGYNNCCDPKKTGEAKFIRVFATFNPSLCIDIGANVGDYADTYSARPMHA